MAMCTAFLDSMTRATYRSADHAGAQLMEQAGAARAVAVGCRHRLAGLLQQLRDERVLVRNLLVALCNLRLHPCQRLLLSLQ